MGNKRNARMTEQWIKYLLCFAMLKPALGGIFFLTFGRMLKIVKRIFAQYENIEEHNNIARIENWIE